MQRRIFAAVAAVVLAGIGAVLLYSYVNTSEARAMSRMEPTAVLVVTKAIPAGTVGASIGPFIELKQLPGIAVAPGALTDTSSIADLTATTELQVGEQVMASRFASPDSTATGTVKVPNDMQQVTIPFEAARAVGGAIHAGDLVGVFMSAQELKTDLPLTGLQLRGVLVVRVQGALPETIDDTTAPAGGSVSVTLALRPADATRIVYGMEHAKLWLALEPKDGGSGTTIVTGKTVLK